MEKKLYLVSTPIGNYKDITLRALDVLKKVDFIICEEFKEANRLLSTYNIKKELYTLNEHNEEEVADEILQKILDGSSAALISDCGTPLFSDPGHLLVDLCIFNKIKVVQVPGANSLLPALIGSGFDFETFYFRGWLSQKKDVRRKQLLDLKRVKDVIVLMDTPYRLKTLLIDIVKILGKNIPLVVAFELTTKDERFYRGKAESVLKIVEDKKLKGEFVLVLNNES